MLHLLHALSDTGTAAAAAGAAAHHRGGAAGMVRMPPRVFSEPSAGLSGIGLVGGRQQGPGGADNPVVTPGGAAGYGRGIANGGRAHGDEEGRYGGAMAGGRADRHRPDTRRPMVVRRTTEVTERTLLKGILYAFQVRKKHPAVVAWGNCVILWAVGRFIRTVK